MLFGHLMKLSLELNTNGEYHQELGVTDEMIAVAGGTSCLCPRRGHRYPRSWRAGSRRAPFRWLDGCLSSARTAVP